MHAVFFLKGMHGFHQNVINILYLNFVVFILENA